MVFCFYSYVGPSGGQGVNIVSRCDNVKFAKNSELLWLLNGVL